MLHKKHASILLVGNDVSSDNGFKTQLEQSGYCVEYVSSEHALIKRVLQKENRIDLIIISEFNDDDKPVISDNIMHNINIPIIRFTKLMDRDTFLSDINNHIEKIIGMDKQHQEQNDNNDTQVADDLFEAFALHEIICDDNGKAINYRFLDADKKFLKRVCKKKEELIGKTALELFPNTEKIWIETFGRVALSGNPEVFMHYSTEFDKYYEARIYSPEKGTFLALFIDLEKTKGKYVCKYE